MLTKEELDSQLQQTKALEARTTAAEAKAVAVRLFRAYRLQGRVQPEDQAMDNDRYWHSTDQGTPPRDPMVMQDEKMQIVWQGADGR